MPAKLPAAGRKLSTRQAETIRKGLDRQGRAYLFSWLLEEEQSGVTTSSAGRRQQPAGPQRPPRRDPSSPNRSVARALVSVMLSDGKIRDAERSFVDNLLADSGQAPLAADEVRAWLPAELPAPADAGVAVQALASLVYLDSQPDPSEWRLVREFARSWRVTESRLAEIREIVAADDRGKRAPLEKFFDALRRMIPTT